jgi:hypothetical protein
MSIGESVLSACLLLFILAVLSESLVAIWPGVDEGEDMEHDLGVQDLRD